MLDSLSIGENFLWIDPRIACELKDNTQILVRHLRLKKGYNETVSLCKVVVTSEVEEEVVVERVVTR